MGDIEVRRVEGEVNARLIYKLAEAHIAGFAARRAAHEEDRERRRITFFLPRDSEGLLARTRYFAAYDEDRLVGGALVHPLYLEAIELLERGADQNMIRLLLASRRTLSGLAVDPRYRRRGIASSLVGQAVADARADGVRWLTGFMDETNGSPEFYRQLGFQVGERNVPIPPLPPTYLREFHPGYVNGWWFHLDLADEHGGA